MRYLQLLVATLAVDLVKASATLKVERDPGGPPGYSGGGHHAGGPRHGHVLTPKFMIVDAFSSEAESWYGIPEFNLLERNITVPGLSPLFPEVHCTKSGEICQVVTGEAEINAACSMTALLSSPLFDFRLTYFMVAGVAGINPEIATTASVTFSRYSVQVALQYEIDAREKPRNFSTGYFPQGSANPNEYPQIIYGTEVFELNAALRDQAIAFARTAKLNDTADAKAYRANFARSATYAAGSRPPIVLACDVATADVWFSGALLGDAFANYTRLVTNGTGVYCSTAQEDNAIHEALIRAAARGAMDFTRVINMRTASDFDRPYPGETPLQNLVYADQGGFEPAIRNVYLAGVKVVLGIVGNWERVYKKGVKPSNYVGDILNLLNGTPDFGLPSQYIQNQPIGKRAIGAGYAAKRRSSGMRMNRARGPMMPINGPHKS